MNDPSEHVTPGADRVPSPHPLASALAGALASESSVRVLVLGFGNGRNVTPFTRCGASIAVVEADATRARDAALRFAGEPRVRVTRAAYAGPYPLAGGFGGALATSALLHGTAGEIARAVASVRTVLDDDAPFFATFGSTNDPRFECGRRIDEATFAADGGSEAGIAHAYFDEARLRSALDGFHIESIEERGAAETVGRWAHTAGEAEDIVHWFVRARRR